MLCALAKVFDILLSRKHFLFGYLVIIHLIYFISSRYTFEIRLGIDFKVLWGPGKHRGTLTLRDTHRLPESLFAKLKLPPLSSVTIDSIFLHFRNDARRIVRGHFSPLFLDGSFQEILFRLRGESFLWEDHSYHESLVDRSIGLRDNYSSNKYYHSIS